METYDVKVPDENEFDLSSYTPHYDGLLIALDKEEDAIGYIDYFYSEDDDSYSIAFKMDNCGVDYVFTTFSEMFSYMSSRKKIYSLKLIKFR